MDLSSLQTTLRQFAAERDWERFHTPKNLATALMVEAAELAEIFQWMTPDQSVEAASDKVEQERIGEEVADVLLYLLQLADHCRIDLKRAVGRKLMKNAQKHPPVKPGLPAGPVARLEDDVHVLIDWENVQPDAETLRALVPDATHLWLFHGQTQKVQGQHAGFGDRRTLVPITRPGKNALDFHLSFYMGYIISRHPEARIVVLSNDQGYRPMLEHAEELGFRASLVGVVRAPARKRAVKATGAPAAAPAPAPAKKAAAKKVAPAKKTAAAVVSKPAAKAAAKKAAAASSPAAPKAAAAKVAAKKAAPAKQPAPARKAAKAPTAAKTVKAPVLPPPAPAADGDAAFTEKDYAHVLAAIRKQKQPPTRQARLLGMVRSLLDGGKAPAGKVAAVVARLVADGHVHVDGRGDVRFGGDGVGR
ncbi:nucleotide pyrophosphohydrolase [Ramlibacter sp.]|uniref:nucleotide pyrophosphohydrolase n=1 Tax=Ramlibacter sp. TaxID=1917967 RepID=UPI0035B369B6